jgi:HTH-type transcriptional regulator / antitoxin MqsA
MATKTLTCPVCEEGQLHESRYEGDFKHGGKTIHVTDLECYRCDTCGADPVLEDQIRNNHRRIADAKRRLDGLMTGDEIKAIRESLGLSQSEAAEIFGGGANAFSKYERGDVLQSKAMDKLLRIAARYPFLNGLLHEECELEPIPVLETNGYRDLTSIVLDRQHQVSVAEIKNGEIIDSTSWEPEKVA